MGLQVWLPLTKDLRQQGSSNVTVTNNGATFNSAGKLGGCYYFNRSTPNYLKINNPITTAANGVSMAFWVKIPSNASGNNQIVHIGNGSGWNNNRCTCFIYQSSSSLVFSCGDGGGTGAANSTQYGCKSSALALNTWTHVACTYSAGKMKIYLNGILNVEYNTSIAPSFTSTSYIGVGAAPNAGEPATVYINDVRIYDHTLSLMEVKELAQGFVLHYTLSDKFLEGTTNLVTSITSGGQTTWTNNILTTSGTNADTYFTLNLSESIVNGTQYTISCDAEDIPQGTCWTFPLGQQSNTALSFQIYNGHNEYTFTANNISWGTNRCFMDDGGSPNSARATGAQCKIYNFQIEKKDHATGFAGYGKSRSSNIIYDCSGFDNNGITNTNTFTISNDTPKYLVSTYMPKTALITHPRPVFGGTDQEWTCAMWVKLDVTSQANQYMNNFNSGNQIVYSANSYPLLYLNSGTNDYYNYGNKAVSAGVWTHIVFVFKNSNATKLIYINGVEQTNKNGPNKTSTPSGIPDTVTVGTNLAGYISDYRIYATALSAEDVKSLYQNEAFIDSSGTIYGQIR